MNYLVALRWWWQQLWKNFNETKQQYKIMKGNVRESRNFSSVNAAISFLSSLSVSQPGLAALMSAISFSISATVLDIISIVLFFMIHAKCQFNFQSIAQTELFQNSHT
jgi:hypothetical protein